MRRQFLYYLSGGTAYSNFMMMKHTILIFTITFCTFKLFAQTEKEISLYYGSHYFMPSKGYAHGFGFQKNIFSNEFGGINGEVSFLIGGPYAFNFYTTKETGNSNPPYKILHLTVGSNFEIPLNHTRRNKISIGVLGGYSRYEIPITVQTNQGGSGSVQGYFEPRNKLIFGSSLRYKQGFKVNNLKLYLMPSYNIYKTSIFSHSAGLSISVEI